MAQQAEKAAYTQFIRSYKQVIEITRQKSDRLAAWIRNHPGRDPLEHPEGRRLFEEADKWEMMIGTYGQVDTSANVDLLFQ